MHPPAGRRGEAANGHGGNLLRFMGTSVKNEVRPAVHEVSLCRMK
jgi:hypothetical protein